MFDKLITKDALLNSPWQDVANACKEQSCADLYSAFSAKVEEVGAESEHALPLQLLSSICSMYLKNPEEGDPYGPLWVMDGKRTFLPEDLSDEQAEELYVFLSHISLPILEARIADTLWVSKKIKNKFKAAQIAINAHINAGNSLIRSKHRIRGVGHFERAVAIAAELGRGGITEMTEALTNCWSTLKTLTNTKLDACQYRLARCLYKYEAQNLRDVAGLCYDLSTRHEIESSNWDLSRSYWALTSEIFSKCKTYNTAHEAKKRHARCYITEASSAKSFFVKANALSKAVEAYRRINEPKHKIDIIHKWLLRAQSNVHKEMQSIDIGPIDLSDIIIESTRRVSGMSTKDALIAFALITQLGDPAKLREQAVVNAQKFVLSSLVDSIHINKRGKVVAKVPSSDASQTEPEHTALLAQMYTNLDISCRIQVLGAIEPARRQLVREHNLSANELWPVVTNSPFVPQGRELLFVKGLAAGFAGDFMVAAHLLVPQIENCLRHIIEQCGGITSSLDSDGIQKERTINSLLEDEIVNRILGEPVVFSLKALLVEKTGTNFRHALCHGLFDSTDFYSHASIFVWWLIFRLCYTPWINDWLTKKLQLRKILHILTQIRQQKLAKSTNHALDNIATA